MPAPGHAVVALDDSLELELELLESFEEELLLEDEPPLDEPEDPLERLSVL